MTHFQDIIPFPEINSTRRDERSVVKPTQAKSTYVMLFSGIGIKQHLINTQYTWVITGVAGFIGSSLLDALLSLNQKVIGIDNFSTGFQHNLDDVLSKHSADKIALFTFHELDIRNYERCMEAFKGADFLLHQAALGSVPRSINYPEMTNDVNVGGFISVIRAAKDSGIKSTVYASSSSVYGDSTIFPRQEDFIGKPLSPYAASKHCNELYAEAFFRCYNMKISGLRYFNVFGPRQNTKGPYAAVIPIWIQSLLSNQPTFINGDGETSRDFTFVENAVQANLLAALREADSAYHSIYNVGVGTQISLNNLHTLVSDNLGVVCRAPEYRPFRPGDSRHSLADIAKAIKELSYQPTHNVNEGIKITCEWYKNNQK